MNDQNDQCYEVAESNLFTRLETSRQGTYVIAYSGLLFAHLTPASRPNAEETLTLTYVTHSVTIRGTQLSSLLLAVQKGRAETIRLGGGQTTNLTTTPTIRDIAVTEPIS